jgi:hypothetical protein
MQFFGRITILEGRLELNYILARLAKLESFTLIKEDDVARWYELVGHPDKPGLILIPGNGNEKWIMDWYPNQIVSIPDNSPLANTPDIGMGMGIHIPDNCIDNINEYFKSNFKDEFDANPEFHFRYD